MFDFPTRRMAVLLVALLLAPALAPTASAERFVLRPVIDGSVRDGLEAPKDGRADIVLDGSIVQALNVPQFEDRGVIEFLMPSLQQSVARATLSLGVYASLGPYPFHINVSSYEGDGTLGLDDFDAGEVFTSLLYAGARAVSFDVTSALNSLLLAGGTHAGFNFTFTPPSPVSMNGPFVAFRSLEYGPAATLTVNQTPVPEPGTLVLVGTGALGLLARRRARSRKR